MQTIRFRTKPMDVEGWLFRMDRLKEVALVPEWVRDVLHVHAGRFVVQNNGYEIEVLEGQWLMKMDDGIFPMTQEAVDAGLVRVQVQ